MSVEDQLDLLVLRVPFMGGFPPLYGNDSGKDVKSFWDLLNL
jgi:hypothetical protein